MEIIPEIKEKCGRQKRGKTNSGSEEFVSFGKKLATRQIKAKAGNETENQQLI